MIATCIVATGFVVLGLVPEEGGIDMDAKTTGRLGEDIAAAYLEKKGYVMVERNARVGHGELDLVAKIESFLVFVEVKTRHADADRYNPYGAPKDAVNRKKQETLIKTANAYLSLHREFDDLTPRVDVVEVYLNGGHRPTRIEHYEDAVRKRTKKTPPSPTYGR